MIGLAYLSGTRRAELVALHLEDVDTDPAAIRVVGKGVKHRLVPLSPTVGPLLETKARMRGPMNGDHMDAQRFSFDPTEPATTLLTADND